MDFLEDEYSLKINDYLSSLTTLNIKDALEELKTISPFGLCLKIFRNKKNISQKELSQIIGISENSIYNYENGKSNPTKNNKKKIMDFLGIKDFHITFTEQQIFSKRSLLENSRLFEKKDDYLLKKIKEEINSLEESVFRNVILSNVLLKKELSLQELDNVIMGYKMLNANSNYKIDLKIDKKMEIVLFDKRNDIYYRNFDIDTFTYEVLIPISETIDNIFKSCEKDAQREVNKNNTSLSKKYDILYNILDNKFIEEEKKKIKNKEGGSDE